MKFKVLIILLTFLSGCSEYTPFTESNFANVAQSSVRITNLMQNSGGSGTVLISLPTESFILTNSHVCGVTVNGGVVMTETGVTAQVVSFRRSMIHDLCVIKVATDLHTKEVRISTVAPKMHDIATVSGHPALYPNVVTTGHFSGKMNVNIMIGYKECSEEEKQDPNTGMFCAFVGKLPIIKNYEAQLVSATIMPGSSGSGVFNETGNLSGVVFAGQGDLGYGLIVPLEYVLNFVNDEVTHIVPVLPNTELKLTASFSRGIVNKYKEFCITNPDHNLCKTISSDLIKE